MTDLEDLEALKELFKKFTYTEHIFSKKLWMSHVIHANGFLKQAIEQYEKNPDEERNKFLYGEE